MKETMINVKPIQIETVTLKIKGVSPYLPEPMDEAVLEMYNKKKANQTYKKDIIPEEEKVKHKYYFTEDGKKGILARAFYKSMIKASTYLIGKGDGGMRNVKEGVSIIGDEVLSMKYSKEKVLTHWGRTSGRTRSPRKIMRNAFYDWECELVIQYNAEHLSPDQIYNILNWAGFHIGVGGFRKENTGTFGMFKVEI